MAGDGEDEGLWRFLGAEVFVGDGGGESCASGYRGAKRGAWECGILRAFVSTKDGLSYGREARDGDGGDGVGHRASLFAAVD